MSVTLTINSRSVTVPEGTLVVEAAKQVGIEIPVFCYHAKLAAVGMCRMCLVTVGITMVDRGTGQVELDEGRPVDKSSPREIEQRRPEMGPRLAQGTTGREVRALIPARNQIEWRVAVAWPSGRNPRADFSSAVTFAAPQATENTALGRRSTAKYANKSRVPWAGRRIPPKA